MRKMIFGLLLIFAAQSANSQTELPTEAPAPTSEVPAPIAAPLAETALVEAPKPLTSQVLRGLSRGTANLHFSPFSTWLPMKYGISGGYIQNDRWTFEGEYTQRTISADFKSVDFGKITDRRYGIRSRWFSNANSFNFIFGLSKSEFTAELGNTVVSRIGSIPDTNVLKFESYGPELGVANRWQWQSGVTLGVDWFVMYVPIFKTTDESVLKYINNSNDRSNLDSIVQVIRNIPQFDILKMNLGYSF